MAQVTARCVGMKKRKRELPALVTLLPPCKKSLCSPGTLHVSPARKRKLEDESEAIAPSPQCDRVLPPFSAASPSPPLCKKVRAQPQEAHYKCQKDEAFPEYNSFQYWRNPLPDIDFSELSDGLCGVASDIAPATDVSEEMDS